MSTATFSCLPAYDKPPLSCAVLSARLDALLHREHARVMYLEALARESAAACRAATKRKWLARWRVVPCIVTRRCLSDMAASVSMALHVMLMELLDHLRKGQGMEHPLARLLGERLHGEHDDVMRAMRAYVYERVAMVREGILYHELTHKVALCTRDIERWIVRQSRLVDAILVPGTGQ